MSTLISMGMDPLALRKRLAALEKSNQEEPEKTLPSTEEFHSMCRSLETVQAQEQWYNEHNVIKGYNRSKTSGAHRRRSNRPTRSGGLSVRQHGSKRKRGY